MRILGAVFFLLAGKFATFEQMLLTDQAFFKKWRMRITSARIFFKRFSVGKCEPAKFTNKQHFIL